MEKPRIAQVIAVAAVGVLVIAAIYGMLARDGQKRAHAQGTAPAADSTDERAVPVQVSQPVRRTVTRSLRMPATFLAYEAADLYAKTSGYVAAVRVNIGDRVHHGDALVAIDVPEMADRYREAEAVLAAREAKVLQAEALAGIARAEVERAEAEHTLSHVNHKRMVTLREGNAIPQQGLDEAKSKLAVADAQSKITQARVAGTEADVQVARSEVAMAKAALGRLRTLMGYATIRAPFDGVITGRMVDSGAFVRSAAEGVSTPLLAIATADRLRLVLQIPESDAPLVRIGTEVRIDVKAVGVQAITAPVARTAWALNAATRTMRAEVDLENTDGRLAPGMYAQVTVMLESRQDAVMIPSKAIRVRGRKLSVLVANDTTVEAVPVKTGYDDGIWVEIVEGLRGDEQIIVSADSTVAPGAKVSPVTSRDVPGLRFGITVAEED
jgi:RND family efflux transporter MFP subunit